MKPIHKETVLNSYDVHYQETGRGREAYVLVHGIGVSMKYFIPLADELAKCGVVYVLDLPGFGASPKPDTELDIEDYADIVEAFIAEMGISRPMLIGHSMGCQVVVEAMRRPRSSAQGGVLIGPVINRRERNTFVQAMRLMQDVFREPWGTRFTVAYDYARCGLRWYMRVLPHMMKYPIEERIVGVREKLAIMRGKHDPVAPMNWVEELQSKAHDASLHVVDGAHNSMHDFPIEVAAVCRRIAHVS